MLFQTLDNGLLIDPHDQQSIADALLKLVADKHLWGRCRDNGLKNIHLYSWPEHCRTYLSRVTSCKQRHPKWQRSDDANDSEPDSPGSSLKDIQDLSLSLKMSLDGERNEGIGSLVMKGQEAAGDGKNKVTSSPLKMSANESMEKPENCKFPALRMRKFVLFIAVDCDSVANVLDMTKTIYDAARMMDKDSQSFGFILSTSWSMSEINCALEKAGLKSSQFDAFICNSGSEIYYPSPSWEQSGGESQYMIDSDYQSHIEYRWGGESLKNTLVRWAASVNEKTKDQQEPVITGLDSGSPHCHGFGVSDPSLVRREISSHPISTVTAMTKYLLVLR